MKRMRMVWWFGCVLMGLVATAAAENARNTAEAGMLVKGTIEVNPDGSLHGYTLDKPEKLPPTVVDVVGKTIQTWEFKLSGASQGVVTSTMNLRVVAKPVGDGNFRVTVAGATFAAPATSGDPGERHDVVTSRDRTKSPEYPGAAIKARMSATVYLVLRIGPDGSVQDAVAEQVNLDQYGTQADMERYRKLFADSSLVTARKWTFRPPTQGAEANDPYWVVRVPVSYSLGEFARRPKDEPYGSWHAYIPGPRQTPPWIGNTLAHESPDAMPDGAVGAGDARLKLTTPLGGA